MKLKLYVPVEKIWVGACGYTYRHEELEVDVLAVSRRPAGGNRWHYTAHFKHPRVPPDYPLINGMVMQWIRRADHPVWRPPAFPGKSSYAVIGPSS